MNAQDFIELQILIARLKKVTKDVSSTDNTFKKYHQTSIEFLESIPQHLSILQHSIGHVTRTSIQTQKQEKNINIAELELEGIE